MDTNKKINLPTDAACILDRLNAGGYEAYIVGGCVRDSILGRIPQDWDITTSALPAQAKALFSHTFDTGIQHGTITVVLHRENYEVTTYRIDGDYADCRHPESVSFTNDLTKDLLRRDFTMNAIAYHPAEGFRDPFHGQEDIAAGIIRGVGEPAKRFQEDALRMLRCVRFAAQLGFAVDPETWAALCTQKALIQKISVERIHEELEKLWLAPFLEKYPLLWESGLLAEIDPILSARLIKRGNALLDELAASPPQPILRWCILMREYTPEEADAFLRRLKFDNFSRKRICLLLTHLPQDIPTEAYPLRKLAGSLGTDALRELLTLQAILRPASPHAESLALLEEILSAGDCLSLKALCISGKELMALGAPHGKGLGELLAALLEDVLQNPSHNSPAYLRERASVLLEKAAEGGKA